MLQGLKNRKSRLWGGRKKNPRNSGVVRRLSRAASSRGACVLLTLTSGLGAEIKCTLFVPVSLTLGLFVCCVIYLGTIVLSPGLLSSVDFFHSLLQVRAQSTVACAWFLSDTSHLQASCPLSVSSAFKECLSLSL